MREDRPLQLSKQGRYSVGAKRPVKRTSTAKALRLSGNRAKKQTKKELSKEVETKKEKTCNSDILYQTVFLASRKAS